MHSSTTSARSILRRIERVKASNEPTCKKIERIIALRKSLKKEVERDKTK